MREGRHSFFPLARAFSRIAGEGTDDRRHEEGRRGDGGTGERRSDDRYNLGGYFPGRRIPAAEARDGLTGLDQISSGGDSFSLSVVGEPRMEAD